MLKITRRPYAACAYRWALSTSGINTGEGDCSDAQCEELNGTHLLTYRPCASKGHRLIWETDCESSGSGCLTATACKSFRYELAVAGVDFSGVDWCTNGVFPFPGTVIDYSDNFNGTHILTGIGCHATNEGSPNAFENCLLGNSGVATKPVPYSGNGCGATSGSSDIAWYATTSGAIPVSPWDVLTPGGGQYTSYDRTSGVMGDAAMTYTKRVPSGETGESPAFPDTLTLNRLPDVDSTGSTGPDKNDRIRSKWHLSFDIEAQLWTLRSFNRIDYPIYTLSDSDPCTGFTKTLLLADKGSAADGCGVAPAEVTITRECPPDRVGKSALLEDRKPNGATGKTKRQCGCDCQDEVDDRRSCATKCTSTEDEGCGNIDPAPDDITCRYPEAINCCENTAGKDVPCAYVAEFECDIFFDIEDVRHKIAAKQVTLRRKCYFENGCEFVAAGPESSTGGSPVMDTDGFPGAQPVCSSCADLCLTGCTWDAWTVAECPVDPLPCGVRLCGLANSWDIVVPAFTTTWGVAPQATSTIPSFTMTIINDSPPQAVTLIDDLGADTYTIYVTMTTQENCVLLELTHSAFPNAFVITYAGTPSTGDCPSAFTFTKTSTGEISWIDNADITPLTATKV